MSQPIPKRQYFTMCLGECFGTFLLVFIGTGAVAVLFGVFNGLLQMTLIWGIGVTLAIYATRHLSCAHPNPAVSLAMVIDKRMNPRLLPGYWLAQMLGGIIAGIAILLIFGEVISQYEAIHAITRGEPTSITTAMFFGDVSKSRQ